MSNTMKLVGHETCKEGVCEASGETRCRLVGTHDCKPSFAIEDYYLYEVDNVDSVCTQHHDNYGWEVSYNPTQGNAIEKYYFCVDTIFNETWPHWIDESAIYLLLFHRLKKIYPTLQIYSLSEKEYKKTMYRTLNISLDDVVFSIESKQNRFIFPYYISLADHRTPFRFFKHMQNFFNYIVERCPTKEKDIDILYLPRGKKENTITPDGKDRQINIQPMLIQALSGYPNVTIYYTDDTTNMINQWDIVRRAKIILLNQGGNHGINGFFAYNSKIIVLGGHGHPGHIENPCPALMYYDSFKRNNAYYHIPCDVSHMDVLHLLNLVISNTEAPIAVPKFSCWRKCSFCKYQEYEK